MDNIKFELKKVERYDLKPFGKFLIKFKTRQGHLPNIIPFDEVRFTSEECMPVDEKTDKEIIKFMKLHKTDVLTDGFRFYTRIGKGFGMIYHKKLGMYQTDETFRNLVDEGDSFSTIMKNNA